MDIRKTLTKDFELEREFSVLVPQSVIVEKVARAISERQKTYKLDGFRVGKVPLDIIKKREFNSYFYKTSEDFINEFVYSLSNENGYKLALDPKVDLKTLDVSSDVEFTVVYELMPEISEIDLKTIRLDSFKIALGDRDMEEAVDRILENHKEFIEREEQAQLEDEVLIDFSGTIDGESFVGSTAEGYRLRLGSKSFVDNFEEQIVGRSAGEEFDVRVTFPENYHASLLARKSAVFRVKLNSVLKPNKRTLSDEFVKSTFGIDDVPKFKEFIHDELVRARETMAKNYLKSKLIGYLHGNATFNLPRGLVDRYHKGLMDEKKIENLRKSVTDEIDSDSLKTEAERAVRISLIISKIGRENNIVVGDSDVTHAIMQEALSMSGREKDVIDYYTDNHEARESVRYRLLRDKITDFILENIEKNEIDVDMDEFEKIISGKN
ncbi:MAG: trigger factor [Rickettsiales bacterium]|jgi:trigger factor|nr:trigger factor [Rickettsiales bacterium]